MAAPKRTFTVEECLQYLDDNFDIPGDGLDSDCKDLSHDESELQEPEVSDLMMPETEQTANRILNMDLVFDDDLHCEYGVSSSNRRGRPTGISLDDEQWEQKRIDVKSPTFLRQKELPKFCQKRVVSLNFFCCLLTTRFCPKL